MKRLVLILIVVFAAGTLLAGEGKSCDTKKSSVKTVELTGTLASEGDNTVFRVANTDQSYTVCHKTAAKFTKLAKDGAAVAIKGKLVSCDESAGEELVIESARKI